MNFSHRLLAHTVLPLMGAGLLFSTAVAFAHDSGRRAPGLGKDDTSAHAERPPREKKSKQGAWRRSLPAQLVFSDDEDDELRHRPLDREAVAADAPPAMPVKPMRAESGKAGAPETKEKAPLAAPANPAPKNEKKAAAVASVEKKSENAKPDKSPAVNEPKVAKAVGAEKKSAAAKPEAKPRTMEKALAAAPKKEQPAPAAKVAPPAIEARGVEPVPARRMEKGRGTLNPVRLEELTLQVEDDMGRRGHKSGEAPVTVAAVNAKPAASQKSGAPSRGAFVCGTSALGQECSTNAAGGSQRRAAREEGEGLPLEYLVMNALPEETAVLEKPQFVRPVPAATKAPAATKQRYANLYPSIIGSSAPRGASAPAKGEFQPPKVAKVIQLDASETIRIFDSGLATWDRDEINEVRAKRKH